MELEGKLRATLGEGVLLDELEQALTEDELRENLEYIARQHDIN